MNSMTKAVKAAFPLTIPIMTGYIFLGFAFGVLMTTKGLSPVYSVLMSIIIYAGSMQFVAINLLLAAFNPLSAFLMTLMVNARQLFYGLSMLDKFKDSGLFKPYLIFSLTDETYSVLCSQKAPAGISQRHFMLAVSMLDHFYWVLGSLLGATLGGLISFNTEGLDFALTALFVVIFVNQWKTSSNHVSALTGVICSVICLVIFKAGGFIIPSMILILICLSVYRRRLEGGREDD